MVQQSDDRKNSGKPELKNKVYHFAQTSLSLAKLPAGIALLRLDWYNKVKPVLQNM